MKTQAGPLARDSAQLLDDPRKRLLLEVQILYDLLPSAQWVNIAAAMLVFGLLAKYVPLSLLIEWLSLVVVVVVSRIVISDRYKREANSVERAQYWFNWFLIGTTLYGVMWSGTAILLVPSDPPAVAAITGLLICGLAAGAVAVSSVNLKVFLVFAASTMWPYAVFLIASKQDPQALFGYLILFFSAIIAVMAVRVHRSFTNLVNLQLRARVLEEEIRREYRKRELAERALLDNTLEEELADRIRQRSNELSSGLKKASESAEYDAEESTLTLRSRDRMYRMYLDMLNGVLLHQVESAGGFITLLKETHMTEEQQRYLGVIDKLLKDASSTMKKVSSTEEATIEEEVVSSVDEISVRRLLIFLSHEIPLVYKAKFITIKRNVDPGVPKKLYGNSESLQGILRELIRNSMQYSDGGTVEVTVQKEFEDEDQIVLKFSVADSGVGMAPEVVEYLLGGNGDAVPPGKGLAKVKKLVAAQSGTLHARGVRGVGSTVEVTLPFYKTESSILFDA